MQEVVYFMDGAKVKTFLQQQFDNYVKDLESLTNIDSGNGDPEGTDRAAKFVGAKLQALGPIRDPPT